MILYQPHINLASAALGAAALSASDEFFGPRYRLLSHQDPVFVPGKYDENGKWMDGWESRRKRGPGHDHCIIRLACPGRLVSADIDTAHFTGNYPKAAGLEAACCLSSDPNAETLWIPILAPVQLQGNSHNIHAITDHSVFTHVRLNIYPDGGIARLRLLGTPETSPAADGPIDLAAALNGGRALACNDAHFGDARNLLLPGLGERMEDGWETARRREPGNDWVIIALGRAGTITRIEVDTSQFKGNYPDQCSIQAAFTTDLPAAALVPQSLFWAEMMGMRKLGPDQLHVFTDGLAALGPVSHVRFNIFPDGGVNRLRLFGPPMTQG